MTFDLNEARRLHERSKSNPKVCGTCVHPTQPNYMHLWPCPTAVALGATGRSEWVGVLPGVGVLMIPDTVTTSGGDAVCGRDSDCIMSDGHEGYCMFPDGMDDALEPESPYVELCGDRGPYDTSCILLKSHDTWCRDDDERGWQASHEQPKGRETTLTGSPCPGHVLSEAGVRVCDMATGHIGACHYRDMDDATPRCDAKLDTLSCVLPTGHVTEPAQLCSHLSPTGTMWGP